MELKDTVTFMESISYKNRFIAEYHQTKIRYEKLKKFNTQIKAALMMGKPEPEHDCPLQLLREQQETMGRYLHLLEVRAEIENIDLNKPLEIICDREEGYNG